MKGAVSSIILILILATVSIALVYNYSTVVEKPTLRQKIVTGRSITDIHSTAPEICKTYYKDGVCDAPEAECPKGTFKKSGPYPSVPECNECQTGGYPCGTTTVQPAIGCKNEATGKKYCGPLDSKSPSGCYCDEYCEVVDTSIGKEYDCCSDYESVCKVQKIQYCDFIEKYTAEPDEGRLVVPVVSKEKIREAVVSNIKEVVITDLAGNEENLNIQWFADSLAEASFNFLSIKKLKATFYHQDSGKCVETMERFDFDPPISPPPTPISNFLISTGFLSTMTCDKEWKETQKQWSNAAPLESFFRGVAHMFPLHDLIFDKQGHQLVFAASQLFETAYFLDAPKFRSCQQPITTTTLPLYPKPVGAGCDYTKGYYGPDGWCDDEPAKCKPEYVKEDSLPQCKECSIKHTNPEFEKWQKEYCKGGDQKQLRPHVYILEEGKKFYEEYPGDKYDFIGNFRHKDVTPLCSACGFKLRKLAEKGSFEPDMPNYATSVGSAGRLAGAFDFANFYKGFVKQSALPDPIAVIDEYYFSLIFHELSHITTTGSGLPKELDVRALSSLTGGLDPSHFEAYAGTWISQRHSVREKFIESEGKYYFTKDCSKEPKHHDFELYSMGLKSPQEVKEKLVIPKSGVSFSIACDTTIEVALDSIRKSYSIQDFINVLGPRIPSVENSQKDFAIAFVIIVPKGYIPTNEEIDAINWLADKLPVVWYKSTKGRSTLNGIKPKDLAQPLISNVKVSIIESSIIATWDTNEPASSFVIYTPKGGFDYIYPNVITNPPKFSTTHNVIIEDLVSAEYDITIISIDENYNMASFKAWKVITGESKNKPDLTITDVKFKKSQPLDIAEITIKNIGIGNVKKHLGIEVRIVDGGISGIGPLKAGETATLELPLYYGIKEGQEVIVKVDAQNTVDEVDETNNEFKTILKF